MFWASTRINKNAAAAFDAETVDTDEFVIRKPEGFLHVLNDDSGLAFRSYSKEFGKVVGKDVRRATIEIEKHSGTNLEAVTKAIKASAESVGPSESYLDAEEKAAWINSTNIINGGEFAITHKLVTRGADVWEARGSVLVEHQEELAETIEATLDSVRVK
jgi:hypothetical protein